MLKHEPTTPARNQQQHSMLCGSPDTVAEAIAEIDSIGVGGLILVFRLGPMPYERNNRPNAANRAEETLRTSLWQSGTRRC